MKYVSANVVTSTSASLSYIDMIVFKGASHKACNKRSVSTTRGRWCKVLRGNKRIISDNNTIWIKQDLLAYHFQRKKMCTFRPDGRDNPKENSLLAYLLHKAWSWYSSGYLCDTSQITRREVRGQECTVNRLLNTPYSSHIYSGNLKFTLEWDGTIVSKVTGSLD